MATPDATTAFEKFFSLYPRKEAREAARTEWQRLWRSGELPEQQKLLAALAKFRDSQMWQRENGRFIPYLANWLRGRRWLDEADQKPHSTPENAESRLRQQVKPMELPKRAPDPELAATRPMFESFISRFGISRRTHLGLAWGLWSLLWRQGRAPTAEDVDEAGNVFEFLQRWKRQGMGQRECHAA